MEENLKPVRRLERDLAATKDSLKELHDEYRKLAILYHVSRNHAGAFNKCDNKFCRRHRAVINKFK